MLKSIAKRVLITATVLMGNVAASSAFVHGALVFSLQHNTAASSVSGNTTTLAIDIFGRSDTGTTALSTYGIRLSRTSAQGTFTSADDTNAVVQGEWQEIAGETSVQPDFNRTMSIPAVVTPIVNPTFVDFRAGTGPLSSNPLPVTITTTNNRIGRAFFQVQTTAQPETVSFLLGPGPTGDDPDQNDLYIPNDDRAGTYFVQFNQNNSGAFSYTAVPSNLDGAGVTLDLVVTAVPEPSSLLLASLVLGGVPYGVRLRRRLTQPK